MSKIKILQTSSEAAWHILPLFSFHVLLPGLNWRESFSYLSFQPSLPKEYQSWEPDRLS